MNFFNEFWKKFEFSEKNSETSHQNIGLAQTQWICVDYIRRDCILKCSVYFVLFLEFSAEPFSKKLILHKTHYSKITVIHKVWELLLRMW